MTAEQIFDEIASRYHGRMQTAGTWVPYGGGYVIDVFAGVSPADWVVRCGNRIVDRGGASSPHAAWRGGCDAIANDLADEARTQALLSA